MEFLHLSKTDPVPSYGIPLNEYASEEAIDNYVNYYKQMGIELSHEEAYDMKRTIWEWHHPPVGVKGIYAFVNNPENIDVRVMPGSLKRELRAIIIKSYDLDSYPEKEQRKIADEYIRIILGTKKLSFSHVYTSNEVKRVFGHFYGDSEWYEFAPEEFEQICTDDIYEVFLELK